MSFNLFDQINTRLFLWKWENGMLDGLAVDVNLGSTTESPQERLQYYLKIFNDIKRIVQNIQVDLNDVVLINVIGEERVSTVSISLQDDGGTALGGVNTSLEQVLSVVVTTALIFLDDFGGHRYMFGCLITGPDHL